MGAESIAVTHHTLRANGIRQHFLDPMTDASRALVWSHVINTLMTSDKEGQGEAYLVPPARGKEPYAPSRHVLIEVTERLSEASVAVLWRDATRGCYADQVWIFCRARVKGRCGLSGAVIRRGDFVYKPRVRSAAPANAAAMILASVVAGMPSMAVHGD
ncbi:uncharacterized protein DUF3331 [Paraburkholderia sp. BL23I1N1]|uniref:DUF3331 domain-containing protein n=1 Tax=Paraburkholderia sp. BL23I1N1 TaxID=1938802 RepID=UPI000E74F29E|nr:DUF3331 domain-containing protein [Paraburkholderia sp. BL23I1N1]RKE39228.1 uncharacterized protein DUF3331 [Paraburkholderia sp. BL23I1N1]